MATVLVVDQVAAYGPNKQANQPILRGSKVIAFIRLSMSSRLGVCCEADSESASTCRKF